MSTEKAHFQKAFSILKPACDAFITEPNDVNTKLLKNALVMVPEYALTQLQPYVLIPLEIHLKTNKSNCTLNVLDVLTTLLKKTSISLWPTFMRIYKMLVEKLSHEKKSDKAENLSEDIKLSIIVALNSLVEKADIVVLNQMFSEVDCKHVGYLIYICTIVIKNEKMNILRVEALKCIGILSSIWDKNIDSNIRFQIIQRLIKFVPGVLSVSSIIVNATDIQHHSITVAALNLWSTITSLIICDDHVIEDCNTYLGESICNVKNDDKKILNDWIQENSTNFNLVATHMIKTREHQHWRVRLQLVSSCDVLLSKCTSSMKSSITNLIETLIVLSDDEQPEVEKLANESVDKLHKIFDGQNKKSLLELLEESFYILLSRIPRFIRTSNYIKQKTELSLLCGYIKLFGKTHLSRVLNSYAHLDRLTTVLIQILELEYKTITLLEESSIRDLNCIQTLTTEMSINVPWKQLIHFNDTSALYKIECICKLIGLYGDCNFIGRYLMDLFESKIMYRKEITLLMNMILSENNGECHYSIVRDVIDLYLECNFWYLPTSIENDSTTNIADAQKNVVQICLMTEGLAKLVSSLPVTQQHLCLIHCLYPILERVGSEHGPISLAGQGAITLLARSGGYSNPIDLVVKNSDYLSHHFTNKLWSLSKHPEVLNALKVVMNLNGSDDLLQSFHTMVTEVLVQSCDVHRTENMHSFMKVFHIFVMCVRKREQKCTTITDNTEKSKSSSNCVIENILGYHKMMTLDLENNLDDEYWENEINSNAPRENNENIDEDDEDNKKPLPPYIQMVLSIMKRVLHYLPSKHNSLPLQILNEGLNVISNYENQLLPMVHKIWSPLCTKFNNNTDDIVFREAFNVLTTMASTAKDFIRSRSLKQVLPTIIERLASNAKESNNVLKGSVYFTSHKYKMQYTILSGLADFVLNLNFLEKDMYDVSNSVAHYLEKDQPIELQKISKEFYRKLHAKHSDFVWIYLQSLYVDEYEFKSDNARLPTIKICCSSMFNKSNISKNVSELLEPLNL
ncbi:TELO2-interacting protein 1 homolog isoform X1 [Metopolophium dirhodum]|uniref:TELO2-interacting protein 1 homolog isoform X1 n=2 Tax=Metopolophium dirhodum TaxID=44670 RepID=UPI0029903534|nr:TELO2-interacting protein 1 homolog isoform X1 [Metopolophium dirhodum]